MDTRTGEIKQLQDWDKEARSFLKEIDVKNLPIKNQQELLIKGSTTCHPRARCPCGSKLRFKDCCMMRPA